jgi:RNA-directed DNA polymerase
MARVWRKFEENLKGNLYKIWNRMSSGSYFPPPVRRVDIPKGGGKMRPLGIPTVADRIAQMVVKKYLEPEVEPLFHPDSYGYRPNKSALEAVGTTRKRCWSYKWVVDLDLKGFFDSIDHDLMLRAVRKHTECKWILLYIERWLKAPMMLPDGTVQERTKGTPQGGVASPLLANIFLHHAFDVWMSERHPRILWERYADDIIVHCVTEKQARYILAAIKKRMRLCKLKLNLEKTKIVYCKRNRRNDDHPHCSFDFLGFTFRPRITMSRGGETFVGFNPAVSRIALKKMADTVRSWHLGRRSDLSLEEIAQRQNSVVRGWINYYGAYHPSALFPLYEQLTEQLVKWAKRKYKKLRRYDNARKWLRSVARQENQLFAYWRTHYRMHGGIIRAV